MDEHAYFRAIEEHFIRLRGAPLLLSPADWRVAGEWRRQGIPLELVQDALDEVFARRAERGGDSPIQSLRYCASAVEAAWKRRSRLSQAGHREEAAPLDLAERLEALAAAIPAELDPEGELGESVRALAERTDGAQAVEDALAALDRRMVATALGSVDDDRRARIESAADRGLAAVGRRLPADEAESTRERLREQALRRELDLPVLSLFADL